MGVAASEAMVPALKAVFAERSSENRYHPPLWGVSCYGRSAFGPGYAGGGEITILIKMLEDETERNGVTVMLVANTAKATLK